jgi:tetratricopeptide (TPR) repeat protein
VAGINSDWSLFRELEKRNAFLGELSPAKKLSAPMHANLMRAADDVIERYRNNSDPAIENFDWRKAQVCLQHVLDMDHADHVAQGRLALVEGYLDLVRANADQPEQRHASVEAAQAKFQESVSLLPRAADPHLGLARIYIYSVRNVGKAVAELHEAKRLGFQPGPREMEQEADGYRFRAKSELILARAFRGKSRTTEGRYLRLAQSDYDRARQLYEPILGYSNVSAALHEVDDDDEARQELADVLKKPVKAVKRQHRTTARRYSRWQ